VKVKVTETITREKVVCDLTGRVLGDTGWAIVRRFDGLEVAHFSSLASLVRQGNELHDAARRVADTEEP
jgi:hypothetical protein